MKIDKNRLMTRREWGEALGFKDGDYLSGQTVRSLNEGYARYVMAYQQSQFRLNEIETRLLGQLQRDHLKRKKKGLMGAEGMDELTKSWEAAEKLLKSWGVAQDTKMKEQKARGIAPKDYLEGGVQGPYPNPFYDKEDPESEEFLISQRTRSITEQSLPFQMLKAALLGEGMGYMAQMENTTPDRLGGGMQQPLVPSPQAAGATPTITPDDSQAGRIPTAMPAGPAASAGPGSTPVGRILRDRQTGQMIIQDPQTGRWVPYTPGMN